MKNVDPNEQLDEDVEDLLLSYADEYMESVMEGAAVLASHRKSNVVEIKDIHTHLGQFIYWFLIFGLRAMSNN